MIRAADLGPNEQSSIGSRSELPSTRAIPINTASPPRIDSRGLSSMQPARIVRVPAGRPDHRVRVARPKAAASFRPVRIPRSISVIRVPVSPHAAKGITPITRLSRPPDGARPPGPPPHRSRHARRSARRWRRHGHRAQVSAIATILGLLLVVTFIANYLATTLPNQMEVNDLNHEVQVENQLGHLSRSLESISAGAMVGASFAQPIAMGSAGAPPFANPDGGSISSLQKG